MNESTRQKRVAVLQSRCIGCENDFYNGKNPLGVEVCWNLKRATMILRKRVPMWMPPPWNMEAHEMPSCYREQGYVHIDEPKRSRRLKAVKS